MFDYSSLVGIGRILAMPPVVLFGLAAVGWVAQRWWPRFGRTLTLASLALLLFLCTGFGASLVVGPLERKTTPLASTTNTGAQAIVVLASGRIGHAPEYGGLDIPDHSALGRLRYAARLQRETGLPILVTGGNARPGGDGYSKADAMAKALREDFGVPVKWIEGKSEDTIENARFSAPMLLQDGVGRILLVTDAMHMPRARIAFVRTGLDIVEAPTVFVGAASDELGAWVPSASNLGRSQHAIHEWAGFVWYWIRFRD